MISDKVRKNVGNVLIIHHAASAGAQFISPAHRLSAQPFNGRSLPPKPSFWYIPRIKANLPSATQSFQFNIFWGFKSELQMNPMPFHLESLWGATLMLQCIEVCDGQGQKEIVRVDKNSSAIFVDESS